uniref:Putative isac anti-complement n=1 Tax=Ixodes ricinus TaxID=34613 RepID=A0A0K8R918_IXORI
MKTALTCALFGILFFGSHCSSNEEVQEQEPAPSPQGELYERYYKNASNLCGSWYRNESILESIYNCTLRTLGDQGHTIVNTTWEDFRRTHNLTIPGLVGLMCNFSVAMPSNFYTIFTSDETLEEESPKSTEEDDATTETPPVPERDLLYAEGNCSEKIHGSTTQAPTTPSELAKEAME